MMSSKVVGTPGGRKPGGDALHLLGQLGRDLGLVKLDGLLDEEGIVHAHRLIGHRLVDADRVGILGGGQIAVLEPALERRALDLDVDPAIDVVARGALQPTTLLLGKPGDRGGGRCRALSTGRRGGDEERRRGANPCLEHAATADGAFTQIVGSGRGHGVTPWEVHLGLLTLFHSWVDKSALYE